uniref:Putative secreted protein n=1 Tax=Anopheles darlingi TaxID=43151 RepID=A0A2M4D0X6_ANODA
MLMSIQGMTMVLVMVIIVLLLLLLVLLLRLAFAGRIDVLRGVGQQHVPLLDVLRPNVRRRDFLGVVAREPTDGTIPDALTLVPTVGHFAMHVHHILDVEIELVWLEGPVRVNRYHLRTVPLFVDFLVGVFRSRRFRHHQPPFAFRLRGAT